MSHLPLYGEIASWELHPFLRRLVAVGGGNFHAMYYGGIGITPLLCNNTLYPFDLYLFRQRGTYYPAAVVNGTLLPIETLKQLHTYLPALVRSWNAALNERAAQGIARR